MYYFEIPGFFHLSLECIKQLADLGLDFTTQQYEFFAICTH